MGGLIGSTWGGTIFHGHAEWVETRDLTGQTFALQLTLWPFEVSHVCVGSHLFAMFSAHALREGRGQAHINMTTITHFGQN